MLLSIIIIFLVLILLALLYYYKSRILLPNNNKIGSSDSIRYDSKISLCSLIFDQLNSVLYVSYGKNHTEISFAAISAYKITVNSNCVMTISKDDAQTFDEQAEENLLSVLHNVEKENLSTDESRQISLEIFSVPEAKLEPVLVNFYYREGDLRFSPHSFARAVEDLLLWCDLLESAIRPVLDAEPEALLDTEQDIAESLNLFSDIDHDADAVQSDSGTTQANQNSHDLADELTRLSDLKAKGFLSEEEFTKAKDKIIN